MARTRAAKKAQITRAEPRSATAAEFQSACVTGTFRGEGLWIGLPPKTDREWVIAGTIVNCVIREVVMTFHVQMNGYTYAVTLKRVDGHPNGFDGEWVSGDDRGRCAGRLLPDTGGYLMTGIWEGDLERSDQERIFIDLRPISMPADHASHLRRVRSSARA